MGIFRITLDGQDLGDPVEWRETSIITEWSDDVLTTLLSTGYTFYGDAYAYLVDLFDSNFCSVVACKIYSCGTDTTDLIYEGRIYLSDAEVDRINCTIRVNVSDVDWNAYIKNKTKQKFFVNVGRSSDGSIITAAASTAVTMHNVSTGAGLTNDATCYSVFEVLKFLVAAMSDGNMGFVSDFFTDGDGQYDMLTTGLEIRDRAAQNPAPEVSWNIVYDDLKNIYNLRVSTEEVSGQRVVRVEPYWYYQDATESLAFSNLESLSESIDVEQLYSQISLGSRSARKYDEDTPNTSFTNTSYLGWDQEDYNVAGDCVVSNSLELKISELIVDSNSIENQINGNDNQDDEVFLLDVETAYPSGYQTVQSDLLGTGDSTYNAKFTNNLVLERWNNRIHNTIFRYENAGGADFEARTTSDQDVVVSCSWGDPGDACGYGSVIPYDNEVLDTGGNYDEATNYVFTLPSSGTYLFVFDYNVDVLIGGIIGGLTGPELVNKITTTLYESTGAVDYATRDFVFTDFRPLTGPGGSPITATKNFQFSHFFAYTGLTNDEIRGYVTFTNNTGAGPLGSQATFKTGCAFRSEGLIANPNSVVRVFQTQAPVTPEQWRALQDNRSQQIALNSNQGYVRRFEYRPFGTSSIQTDSVISL